MLSKDAKTAWFRKSYCCDRKARAACEQSFTLWQQATIEITCHGHPVIACSCHIYMGVILRAHPIRGESHIQRNANREVATYIRLSSRHLHHRVHGQVGNDNSSCARGYWFRSHLGCFIIMILITQDTFNVLAQSRLYVFTTFVGSAFDVLS